MSDIEWRRIKAGTPEWWGEMAIDEVWKSDGRPLDTVFISKVKVAAVLAQWEVKPWYWKWFMRFLWGSVTRGFPHERSIVVPEGYLVLHIYRRPSRKT